jgi:enoyl-CoA hydratase/carnithine racemase
MPDTFTVTHERPAFAGGDQRSTMWRVTFDNPPTNVVDPDMIIELDELVGQLEADADVKVVVFDSANRDHFLGPYDMSRAAETPNRPGPTGMPTWLDLTSRLSRLPAVSIAAIRGTSRGVGNEFALACDMRFASLERARLDQPEVSRALVPGGGAIARLPGLIGRARTLEVILGSVVLDAATAERYGLVNRAVLDDDLDRFVDELATAIAGHDREALSVAKSLVNLSTLPADGDLISGYQAFFTAAARLPG